MDQRFFFSLLTVLILSETGLILHTTDGTCAEVLRTLSAGSIPEVTVLEGTLAGVVLKNITDKGNLADSGENPILKALNGSIVTKQIVSLDGDENKDLCHNVTSQIFMEIWCEDSPRNPKLMISINLQLTDDHPIEINPVVANVTEELPGGTKFVKLKDRAKDDDCGAQIIYDFAGPSKSLFKFSIPPEGESRDYSMETTKPLDYELQNIHILNLTVLSTVDNFAILTSNWTTLSVIVEDIDDMSPVFDISQFVLHVLEEQNVSSNWDTSYPPVAARDGDVGINTTLTYSVLDVQPSVNLTVNNETGQVKVLEVLDRETDSSYSVVIKAAQTNLSYRTATATLVIWVDDINDNRPVYTGATQASVKEDALVGSRVLELTGTDSDEGENSLFDYIITNDSTAGAFKIEQQANTSRGYLSVANSSLLRHHSQAFVVVKLQEKKSLNAGLSCDFSTKCFINLTIEIVDVNINSPKFKESNYTFEIQDNITHNNAIGQVQATDADRGDNGKIEYTESLVRGSVECNRVTLNKTSGNVILEQNISGGTLCIWLVTACDCPLDLTTRRCDSVPLQVTVIHSGGNITVIQNASIPENVPVGTIVQVLPIKGLTTTSSNFYITNDALLTNSHLDRETQDSYIVTLLGQNTMLADSQSSARGDTCNDTAACVFHMTVHILDVNDNSPQFLDASYLFTVPENFVANAYIGRVTAKDDDIGDNARMEFNTSLSRGPNECKSLFLDKTSGNITLTQKISGDTVCIYLVTVCDCPTDLSTRRCSSVAMQVAVSDSSHNTNVIRNATIPENVPMATIVAVLPIKGLHTNSSDFDISDDVMYTRTNLDREKSDVYEVHLFNQSNTSPVSTIYITITDVNDNAPVFNKSFYYISLGRDTKPGDVILQVGATDADIGNNSVFRFSLAKDSNNFEIDPETGEIRLANFPSVNTSEYIVLATDMGVPPLQGLAVFRVYTPKLNETAIVVLPVEKDKLIADKEGVEKKLSTILGVAVKIYSIENLEFATQVGSKLYIGATSKDGEAISSDELHNLLQLREKDVYQAFSPAPQQSSADSGDSLSVLEIVLICVAAALLLLVVLAVSFLCKTQRKYKQKKRLFNSLHRDTTIYDNPRKQSSPASAVANSINSTNAQRLINLLRHGSIGQSSVDKLLITHEGSSGNNTPAESRSSQRSHGSQAGENMALNLVNPGFTDNDHNHTTTSSADQITSFSSELQDNERDRITGPGIEDQVTGATRQEIPEIDGDENDREVTKILSVTHSVPPNPPGIATQNSSSPEFKSDLQTLYPRLSPEDAAGGGSHVTSSSSHPSVLHDDPLPPEPEPDYAKKVRFSESDTTHTDSVDSVRRSDSETQDYPSTSVVDDNLNDSIEEMTAL